MPHVHPMQLAIIHNHLRASIETNGCMACDLHPAACRFPLPVRSFDLWTRPRCTRAPSAPVAPRCDVTASNSTQKKPGQPARFSFFVAPAACLSAQGPANRRRRNPGAPFLARSLREKWGFSIERCRTVPRGSCEGVPTPAAKRRHVKARHGSAGNALETRKRSPVRDGTHSPNQFARDSGSQACKT